MNKEVSLVFILASLGLATSIIVICLLSFRHDAILALLGSTRFVKLIGLNPVVSILYYIEMICYGTSSAAHRNFANTASCTIFLISTVLCIALLSVLQSTASKVLYLGISGLGVASSFICSLYQSPSVFFTIVTKAAPLIVAENFALQFAISTGSDIVLLVVNACMLGAIVFTISSVPLATLAISNVLVYLDYAGQAISSTALSMATVEASLAAVLVAVEAIKYTTIRKEMAQDVKQKQQRGVANSYATMD